MTLNYLKQNLSSLVNIQSNGCWNWKLSCSGSGYGAFCYGKHKQTTAHRAVYIAFNGELKPGLVIRHKCDNPICVNLEHLEPGTELDNARDRIQRNRHGQQPRRKTHCKRGHERTLDNLYGDTCAECSRLYQHRLYASKKIGGSGTPS